MQSLKFNLIIVGGGITGLWALNAARARGFSAILLENKALGSQQTINSQGIIHSGIKYGVDGQLKPICNILPEASKRWHAALQGQGEVDLSEASILSKELHLWSDSPLDNRMALLTGDQRWASMVKTCEPYLSELLPSTTASTLSERRVQETVIDMPSTIAALANRCREQVFQLDITKETQAIRKKGKLVGFQSNSKEWEYKADLILFCCGSGYTVLRSHLDLPEIKTQERPLTMVSIEDKNCFPVFGHFFDEKPGPAITITSHRKNKQIPKIDGQPRSEGLSDQGIWYLGGRLAEGFEEDSTPLEDKILRNLERCLPGHSLSNPKIQAHKLNRTEFKSIDGQLFDEIELIEKDNLLVTWPSKMTLVPLVVDRIFDVMEDRSIAPRLRTSCGSSSSLILSHPPQQRPAWSA